MQSLRQLRNQHLHVVRRSASSFWRQKLSRPDFESREPERTQQSQSQNISLLDELFPEEAARDGPRPVEKDRIIPRLALPDLDEILEDYQDDLDGGSLPPERITKAAVATAFRQDQLAVLVLQIASKSLIEGDFRRIAPKGKHIKDWTGPGDILKVIPARDPASLAPLGHYYILFPNPAYARTYQSHVLSLQRLARTYTPTSIESPLPIQKGVILQGEDVHALLKDYALCPPTQKMQIKLMFPSYKLDTKAVLQARGYSRLVEGDTKSGRSVLFWVEGQQPTTQTVRNTVAADGRERALAWSVSIEQLDTQIDEPQIFEHVVDDVGAELKTRRRPRPRWILSFTDETEARRFIRAWHRTPFPSTRGDSPKLVHAEFLW